MRPYEHLPLPMPKDYDPGPEFFYENFMKPFIPDMIQMMDTGLTIDNDAVEDLRVTVSNVLDSVAERLEKNPIVKLLQEKKLPYDQKKHAEECTKSVRTVDHYLKEYKETDMVHRTWVVNTYLKHIHKTEEIRDKWSVKDLKQLNIFLDDPFLAGIIDKRKLSNNTNVKLGMRALAEYKLELWNRPRYEKAEQKVEQKPFNPGSHLQVKELFEMLNIKPLATSKDTGEASWGREQLEQLRHETEDPDLIDLLDAMIDYSFGNIIQTNFLKAFDVFTIDDVLHGNIKLFGAKSCRNTSNSPNLLNAPSTGSIYAKPLKRCFIAPDGFVVYTADLSALEDRVIANLSGDVNKCNVFLEGLDGHSLNACGYFKNEIEELLGMDYSEGVSFVKAFMGKVNEEVKRFIELRQLSKAPTFKLAYGGYPDYDKGGVITQELFDNYHNILYPGITDYRENYVLPTTIDNGYIHLGLGCRLYSSDPGGDIRTLNNATVQFWSILTLIAINEFNHRVREAGLQDDVQVISTIYDSIYVQVREDAEILKWVNDNLIELMCVQYLKDEIIHNEAEGEIGRNWADLHAVKNNASVSDIQEILNENLLHNT